MKRAVKRSLNRMWRHFLLDDAYTKISGVLCPAPGREKYRITRHYRAELQTTKQTFRVTSKYSIEFTYSVSCHFKVNRDKLALINRRWKRKKGKGWRLPLVHSRKLTKTTVSPALFRDVIVIVVRDRKIRTALTTNQIAEFDTVPSWEKIRFDISVLSPSKRS